MDRSCLGVPTLFVLFFLFPDASTSADMRSKLRRVDYSGSAALISANIAILLATSWGGLTYVSSFHVKRIK